jgi:hypothetical protein
VRWAEVTIALLVLAAIIAGFVFLLRRPIRSASAIVEKSIAVLPFENLSEDKANAYFADGIQDEILTRLSKIADLKVRISKSRYAWIVSSSSLRFPRFKVIGSNGKSIL